jgi:hypothetical protein
MLTAKLVASVVGSVSDPSGWAGPVACLTVPVIPAVAVAELGAAAVQAVGRGVSWLRGRLAAGLRRVAAVLDAVPVAELAEYPVAQLAPVPVVEDVPVEAAPVLTMASAAQETRPAAGDDLAAVLAEQGSVRAAARHLGVAESTLRGRLKKQGIPLPGRKARG